MIPPSIQAWQGREITLDTDVCILISEVLDWIPKDRSCGVPSGYVVCKGVSPDTPSREYVIFDTGEVQGDQDTVLGFWNEYPLMDR